MADFRKAFNGTAQAEGYWTVDNGGQTYKGISRFGWPRWVGWSLIDKWISANGSPKNKQRLNIPGLDELVEEFYKKNYWGRIYGDYIKRQELANFIFDFVVNSGGAFTKINNAVGGRESKIAITEETLKKLNEDPAGTYFRIRDARKSYYNRLAEKSPKLVSNGTYKGWTARLNKFPKTLYKADQFSNLLTAA